MKAKHDRSRDRLQQAEQIAIALNLDMRQFWTPEAVFLSRLSKVQIAEVMHEAGCSKDAIRAVEKAPKAEAVALAETALRGKTWLPAPLRAPHDDEADTAEAVAIAAE